MANIEQMMNVANHCSGYEPIGTGLESSIGAHDSISCMNCENFKNNKCVKNLFDKVLTGLDQT